MALEQGQAERRLQRGKATCDRWLADPKALRRRQRTAARRDRRDIAQVAPIHGRSSHL